MSASLQTAHVRVNDAATGQPTPVRLRITDSEGQYYAPFGRLTRFATGCGYDVGGNVLLGRRAWAYIDGSCEVNLPAGPLVVELFKGPEFLPQRIESTLGPGKLALRFSMDRWIDLRQLGWYSGDTRAHFLTPQAALLEAAAEDLACVNLLAEQCTITTWGKQEFPAIPNILAFSGQQPAAESAGHLVVVNTHNRHPVLGSLGLLNCHRVVYPLGFGGPEGQDDWTLADWCDQCHRKGGLAVWTHVAHETPNFRYGEPLADLILGKVDALEMDFFEDSPFDALPDWYALLNAGLRVPVVGASGKDGNGITLGSMRTYARLQPGEPFQYKTWVEAIRAGRTMITNGPLLTLTVNDQDPGARLALSSAAGPLRVRAEVRSVIPIEHLEIVVNGMVAFGKNVSDTTEATVLEVEVPFPISGWVAARCRGQAQVWHRPANQRAFAHTSPVYVQIEGQPMPEYRAVRASFLGHLEKMREWARSEARCPMERDRERLTAVFDSALAKLSTSSST